MILHTNRKRNNTSIGVMVASALFMLNPMTSVSAHEVQGEAEVAARVFTETARDPRQHDDIGSVALRMEYWHDWDDSDQRLVFTPYVRVYDVADARTQGDIQEFYWRKSFDALELSAGVRKYFWGKTESLHLVDILNQSDLVEDIDGEDKLGQPVIDLTFINDWGDVGVYLLPYFRERRFPDAQGRVRFTLPVDTSRAVYESAERRGHLDFALRWSHYVGAWDFGVSYFDGTAREPRLVTGLNAVGEPVLVPHYDQLQQFGIDVQATVDAWLWKFEAVHRDIHDEEYFAAVTGVEYTFYGVNESVIDVGILAEHLYDERGTRGLAPFQNDFFLGTRFAFNDVQSSELLLGVIYDPEDGTRFGLIEGSRRIGATWKFVVEGRFFSGAPANTALAGFEYDDYFELSVAKFF